MYDDISEIAKAHGPIASAHADAAPTYVHMIAENSTGGSTGPLARIANLVAAHGVGRDVLYANVRDNGYMIFNRPDGQQQIVADVRYYTIQDAWDVLTGAADGQWANRDKAPAEQLREIVAPLCHQRPFNPGDWVRWFDDYYGRLEGVLMWVQPRRAWFIKDSIGRNHPNVHEDGLTLVEHATSGSDGDIESRHQAWNGRRDFQVRRTGQLWRDAAIIHADTIVRKDGILHFAHDAKVVSSWVEADVEVRHLCDNGA